MRAIEQGRLAREQYKKERAVFPSIFTMMGGESEKSLLTDLHQHAGDSADGDGVPVVSPKPELGKENLE